MKYCAAEQTRKRALSPLAEGRELKFYADIRQRDFFASPLAEGRELK